ncbi:MAG TPA: glycosyltransferase family 2 protein [Pirellulales bacterium]|nr:glycosyltransferase family 2 protein [Pirellulales bacterium]
MQREFESSAQSSAEAKSLDRELLAPAAARPPRGETLVSVVLPVFNELHVLRTLLGRVRQALQMLGVRSEIVFVDDGSTDGSGRMLDEMAARSEQVRVVHFSRNFGHQAAVQAGLRFARGDAVVLMDSDLQDAPEAIGRLLDSWREGYDVVYALREKRKERWWKRLLFGGFHQLLSAVSTTPIPADAGNFSLIDARVVREIVALGERDRYLPGLRSWVGFRQTGVVVERLARYDDRPRVSLRGLWRLAKTAIFGFSSLPLTIFYLIGYSALAIFLALAGYSLYCRLFTNLAIPGWTSYILSASFFGALNALGISMLGEYVLRIYDQVRGRPLYLIDRTMNLSENDPPRSAAAARSSIVGVVHDDGEELLLAETERLLEIAAAATSAAGQQELRQDSQTAARG